MDKYNKFWNKLKKEMNNDIKFAYKQLHPMNVDEICDNVEHIVEFGNSVSYAKYILEIMKEIEDDYKYMQKIQRKNNNE